MPAQCVHSGSLLPIPDVYFFLLLKLLTIKKFERKYIKERQCRLPPCGTVCSNMGCLEVVGDTLAVTLALLLLSMFEGNCDSYFATVLIYDLLLYVIMYNGMYQYFLFLYEKD